MQERKKNYVFLICVVLALATIIAYEPMRHNDFVGIDDPIYITENPQVQAGITFKSIILAFAIPSFGMWHPVTSISHMLDCQLFGLNPFGHHLTSLCIHVANTLLLFLVLKKMTGAVWRSAFVAAVFALHPLDVESIAWVAERKNVLSGFFWILTIAAYTRYAERPSIGRYLLVVLIFSLGTMAKPMVVTLPFALLLLDYWPLCRFHRGAKSENKTSPRCEAMGVRYQKLPAWPLVKEKIPLFVLSAVLSVITIFAQGGVGAISPLEHLPLSYRISNALVSYIKYIYKMIYPSGLAVLYPLNKIPSWQPIASFIVLTVISLLIIISRKRYLTVGWLWYIGTLVPVIGIVQVGSQAMADRYTYLSLIGIYIIIAWGAAALLNKWRYRKIVPAITSCIVLTVFLICTRIQVGYWRNNLTLYGHTAAVTENNFRMHNSYGAALLENSQYDGAAKHFKEALRIKPDYVNARNGLGKALLGQGNLEDAIKCFNEVLRTEPNLADVYGNLGLAYAQLGKDGLAITNWTKSIELDPNSCDNLNNLAWILATTQDTNLQNPIDAVRYARMAYELAEPNQPTYLDTLAAAYAANGNFTEAVKTAQEALNLAEASNKEELAREIQQRLQLYKSGKPYREK